MARTTTTLWTLGASCLTEGLVQRGVDVALFATADSVTTAKLSSLCPRPYSEDPSIDAKVWESLHIAAAFEPAREFDLTGPGSRAAEGLRGYGVGAPIGQAVGFDGDFSRAV